MHWKGPSRDIPVAVSRGIHLHQKLSCVNFRYAQLCQLHPKEAVWNRSRISFLDRYKFCGSHHIFPNTSSSLFLLGHHSIALPVLFEIRCGHITCFGPQNTNGSDSTHSWWDHPELMHHWCWLPLLPKWWWECVFPWDLGQPGLRVLTWSQQEQGRWSEWEMNFTVSVTDMLGDLCHCS